MSTSPRPVILLVEDDHHVRAMLTETLSGEGFTVAQAVNGQEGLRRYEAGGVQLVVTDILMPEMEGLQFIKELRALTPDLPIIAISGGAVHLSPGCNLELASMFGATCVFQKPIDLEMLMKTIADLLEKHAAG